MAWLYLVISGAFEIMWAISLKHTEGFTRLLPIIPMLIGAGGILYFLSAAMKVIPVGTAYVVFTGIGAVGTVIWGMIFFGESREVIRILFISLVTIGVIGLKVTGK
ncbi:MAG: multidrug efflux SMR transporter [Candidatus Gastranaerophilales bacterium]|nr:multidrug efflux SMR transporter [Candidatus Gastranaerophilales bacterium]